VLGQFIPDYTQVPTARVVLGPQDDRFTKRGIKALFEAPYEMTPQSDRMGARLRGASIEHTRGHDIISDGVALGGSRWWATASPSCSSPIANPRVATRRSARYAHSISAGVSGEAGQRLSFKRVTVAEAHELLSAYRAELDHAIHWEETP